MEFIASLLPSKLPFDRLGRAIHARLIGGYLLLDNLLSGKSLAQDRVGQAVHGNLGLLSPRRMLGRIMPCNPSQQLVGDVCGKGLVKCLPRMDIEIIGDEYQGGGLRIDAQ